MRSTCAEATAIGVDGPAVTTAKRTLSGKGETGSTPPSSLHQGGATRIDWLVISRAIRRRSKAMKSPTRRKARSDCAEAGAPQTRASAQGRGPRAAAASRLERQADMTLSQMLADLRRHCDVDVKRNAKGYQETWIGHKLHIDTADGDIRVSCILTSASVRDRRVAIPWPQ
jgi:hypothetical protein